MKGVIKMVTVSNLEYKALKEAGLIKEKRHLQDPNFYNTKHRHFVSEEPKVMAFLNKLRICLAKIT